MVEHVHFKRSFRREAYETTASLFQAATFVFERVPAPFAFSQIPNDLEYETEVTRAHVTRPNLPDVYWLTLLSADVCSDVGLSRLETAPVWKSRTLSGGGHGLVVTEHPYDYRRNDKQRVREHLGLTG